jgi:hypothetical protein
MEPSAICKRFDNQKEGDAHALKAILEVVTTLQSGVAIIIMSDQLTATEIRCVHRNKGPGD